MGCQVRRPRYQVGYIAGGDDTNEADVSLGKSGVSGPERDSDYLPDLESDTFRSRHPSFILASRRGFQGPTLVRAILPPRGRFRLELIRLHQEAISEIRVPAEPGGPNAPVRRDRARGTGQSENPKTFASLR